MEPIRRVAVIFNATEHAGPAVAKRLAAGGADLVVHEPSDELLSALRASESDVLAVAADLRSRRGDDLLVDATLQRFGRLDAAWIRSGVTVGVYGRFAQSSDELWETVKLHNLDMVRWALQAVLPPMVNAGAGQVLVPTSATGLQPEPGASLHAATRAGAIALVRAVGLEYATTGVTVNAIATNFLDVPSFLNAVRATEPARRRATEQLSPMHRLGTAEELAEFAAVLLEGRSRFQTGQCFSFSGGWAR